MPEPARPLATSITLSDKAWLALATLRPEKSELSPLPKSVDASAAASGRARLAETGVLGPGGVLAADWRPAVDALAQPVRRVTLAIGGPDGVSTVHACQGAASGGSFAVYAARSSVATTLAYPVDAADLALPLFEALGLEGNTPDLGIGVDLTLAGFVALMGMVDALREAEAEAMLARDEEPVVGISKAAIALSLKLGWTSGDDRWLVPMARRMLPVPVDIDQRQVEKGLEDLLALDLVRRLDEGRLFNFASNFELPRRTLSAPLAFGLLALNETSGAGISQAFIIGLRTLGALWAVQFVAGMPPLMRIRTLTEADLLGLLSDLIARPPVVEPRSVAQAPNAAAATAPKDSAEPAHRFCTNCGTPLPEGARFCVGCGKQI